MFARFSLFIFCLVLAGCSNDAPQVDRISGHTMGTTYSVVWPVSSSNSIQSIHSDIEQLLISINRQMSTYDAQSELSQFNLAASPHVQTISADFAHVMALSMELYDLSGGYFDVSIGPLVNLWGFGPKKSLKTPENKAIEKALQQVGLKHIALNGFELSKKSSTYIDLSAVAKGHAVDAIAHYLESQGMHDYLVEVGGEIRTKGQKAHGRPWKVAIESPDIAMRKVHKILTMDNNAMATSGDYRNYFEVDGQRFSHSIDPFTGQPVQHKLASVTVIHQNCARADGLATAMLVMGEQKAKAFAQQHQIKAYLIERQGTEFKEYISPAFQAWLNNH